MNRINFVVYAMNTLSSVLFQMERKKEARKILEDKKGDGRKDVSVCEGENNLHEINEFLMVLTNKFIRVHDVCVQHMQRQIHTNSS